MRRAARSPPATRASAAASWLRCSSASMPNRSVASVSPPWCRHTLADISHTCARASSLMCPLSKLLHPGPKFYFGGPGATRLMDDVQIAGGDGIGVEQARGLVAGFRSARPFDAAVDHHVRDVNALRRQFARHALREAAQRELAHREGRRLSKSLHTGGRAGEQDGAVAFWQHAANRLLRHQEGTIGSDGECLLDFRRIEIDQRSAGAEAR